MLKNSRGASNIGCLLTLAIVVCGFYAGYKFAVVQWDLETFKEKLTDITHYWAAEATLEDQTVVKDEIIKKAALCGFTLEPEDIFINTEGVDVTITTSWLEPIVFPGGYVYKRPITVTRTKRKRGH